MRKLEDRIFHTLMVFFALITVMLPAFLIFFIFRESLPAIRDVGLQNLLLDEPCSALDVKSTQTIEELPLKLKESYTIVIVTHNLFQARRIADDCIFMLNGQLWEQNTTEELFRNPQRQETKDYLQGAYA